MFNRKSKKEALKELEKSITKYDKEYKLMADKADVLYRIRKNSGKYFINPVEEYINKLANSPKEFDKSFSIYRAEFQTFNELLRTFDDESIDTNIKARGTAAAGIAAGAGTAALMPSAAMGIATTFGTASTGTAISTLSGAAASNASLAWLGGGTLLKGGAGMAGGKALLALSGPIGASIGAVGLIGGGLLASSKNKEATIKINEKRKEVDTGIIVLSSARTEINSLIKLTNKHHEGIKYLLNDLKNINKDNYLEFNILEKEKVGSLINHIKSLSALLNKRWTNMENAITDNKFKNQISSTIVNSINQNRITDELHLLNVQDNSFIDAVAEIDNVRTFIGSPKNILGSELTKHGEIAEQVEVGVRRARQLLYNKEVTATFENVGRTAPEDYIINNINVQSKFINGPNKNLISVLTHMDKHHDFGRDGSYYHIPKDTFEQISRIRNGEDVPEISSRLKNAILKSCEKIEANSGKDFTEVVKPGISTYSEVQQGEIHNTLNNHHKDIKEENKSIKDRIVEEHKPSLGEGLRTTGIAAAVGATVSMTTIIYKKSKEGKKFYKGEYSSDDWKDLGIETAKGGTAGGIIGGSVYILTNYAGLSAPLAGAVVSATKSVSSLSSDYNNGKIDIDELYELGMIVCSESAIVGLSTVVGQGIIPIPILGAVVGSLAGTILANTLGADNKVTTKMIRKDLDTHLEKIDKKYKILVTQITEEFNKLGELTIAAFDLENNQKLLNLSIDLAIELGVNESELLKNTEEIDDFMLS